MSTLTDREYRALLRNDLATFIRRVFRHLHPGGTDYLHNWHIDLIVYHLERVRRGECRRLILCVPPRSLKSLCVSIAFVAWVLAQDDTRRIICASYGQELADKLARDCRAIMESDWYQAIFPTRILQERRATSDFQTTRQGGRMATSVGGSLTGRGGDILIVDDILKPAEAHSEATREGANGWFDNSFYSRMNDKRTGAIIIITQRVHLNDLIGHVQDKEPWEVIKLPAIAQEDEVFEYSTIFGACRHERSAGEALHPEREPLEVLATIRHSMGEYDFAAQYQQDPVPLGGGLIKEAWIRHLPRSEFPASFDRIVQSWDTAAKPGELADYSACTTWGEKGGKKYLLDVYRQRVDYPTLKRAFMEQFERWRPYVILVEDRSSGMQLIQELNDSVHGRIKAVVPKGDKIMRLQAQTTQFENGMVILPVEAPWLNDYLKELLSFPMGKYDDQVDSTSQSLAWMMDAGREPGIMAYYRKILEGRAGAAKQ